jgi:iron complex outermembrane receptor protein
VNLTPAWLLVGGIRYDDIRLNRTVTNLATSNAVTSANPAYHPLSWRMGTTYDLTKHVTLYGQYTTAVVPVSSMLLQSIAATSFRLTAGHSWEGASSSRRWAIG